MQPGSYLFRLSHSEPSALVIAFCSATDVEQCLLMPSNGGWTLGASEFPSLGHFLVANCVLLKTPVVPLLQHVSPPAEAHVAFPSEEPNASSEPSSKDADADVNSKPRTFFLQAVKVVIFIFFLFSCKAGRSERTCPVCFDGGSSCVLIPCGHIFCRNCVSKVALCPICRRKKESSVVVWL